MMRCSLAFLARSRIGVWPLHLDPPTEQHRAVVRKLLAEYFDNLIILPTSAPYTSIQHSIHLASMSTLAFRDFDRVQVDLNALETPTPQLHYLQDLLEQHPDAHLVHWLPDFHEVHHWQHAEKLILERPFLLLRPDSLSGSTMDYCHGSLPTNLMILDVERTPGADCRRQLFEGRDPRSLLPLPVVQYINSNRMYRDFRRVRTAVGSEATVALETLFPRLQLLHDENNLLAREIARSLRPFAVREGEHPDLIVPIGGDGYMMHCIRQHWKRFIPFFGLNAGHVGYLLNDAAKLEALFTEPIKLYQMSMLYVVADLADGKKGECPKTEVTKRYELAFNDAWMERASGQTVLLNVSINGEQRLHRVRGDGVLVSTAAGSTAYAIALGASPIPVNSSLMQLVGSNVISPSNWKPVHLNQDVRVELESVDATKRPCRGYVDSVDLGIVSRMSIRMSRVAGVQLAFSATSDLQAKLYKLQFPKG